MAKTPKFELMAEPERRKLLRELRQMWRTVPKHARARARQLAGWQHGKNTQFRLAVVHEDASFIDYAPGVRFRVSLIDDVVNGEDAKRVRVQVQCDGRAWEINDSVYARRFRNIEQLNKWVASIEKHLRLHLSQRLFDACFFTWDEAIAKASNDHGVREVDVTALALAHINDLRRDKSKALSIPRGRRKGSKQSKVYLSKRQVEVNLPAFIRENGDDTTRKEAAKRFGLTNEKALDRALAQHGKRWRKLKAEAMTKIKKGH